MYGSTWSDICLQGCKLSGLYSWCSVLTHVSNLWLYMIRRACRGANRMVYTRIPAQCTVTVGNFWHWNTLFGYFLACFDYCCVSSLSLISPPVFILFMLECLLCWVHEVFTDFPFSLADKNITLSHIYLLVPLCTHWVSGWSSVYSVLLGKKVYYSKLGTKISTEFFHTFHVRKHPWLLPFYYSFSRFDHIWESQGQQKAKSVGFISCTILNWLRVKFMSSFTTYITKILTFACFQWFVWNNLIVAQYGDIIRLDSVFWY